MLRLASGQISVLMLECLADIKVIQDWITGRLQRKYWDTCKRQKITCSYRRSDHLKVIGHSNSDYDGCWYKKVYIWLFVHIVGGTISCKSSKQPVIDSFTMEIELVALFEATIQENWLQNFILRLRIVDIIAKLLKFIVIILQLTF